MILTAAWEYGGHDPELNMADGTVLQRFARAPGERLQAQVRCAVETRPSAPFGEFRRKVYENDIDNAERS